MSVRAHVPDPAQSENGSDHTAQENAHGAHTIYAVSDGLIAITTCADWHAVCDVSGHGTYTNARRNQREDCPNQEGGRYA